MADFVGDAKNVSGQWGTVQFAIPDFLENIRDAVNDFATLLITALEIANLALEFVKAFIKGFLDPLVALIEAIIDEILAILADLRQIGIYITGDWALLGWPPKDLRGGFAKYERRMIARLTDRTDPTRPNVSSRTAVIGFFGYLSVDPSEYERLVNFILTIIKLFGLSFFPDTSRFPIPLIQDTLYGAEAASVFNFSSLVDTLKTFDSTPPQICRVTWTAQPASDKHPFNPFPVLGPSGYIVTVSTFEDGIPLKYARPRANTGMVPLNGDADTLVQPREYGSVLDLNGQPVVLHGGAEMLIINGTRYEYNANMQGGAPRQNGCQVFGLLDPASNEIIPLEDLGDASTLGTPGDGLGENFFLQRTFLIESDVALAQWFAGEYSTVLELDDMPHAARWEKQSNGTFQITDDGPATYYYVRVWSVGKQVTDRSLTPQWDLSSSPAGNNAESAGQPFIINMAAGPAAVGMPSKARKVTFVNANTAAYLHALQTALLVLVLSRSDMPLLADIEAAKTKAIADQYAAGNWVAQGFATEATGLEVAKALVGYIMPNRDDLGKPGMDPAVWRATIYSRIRQLALDIYEFTGPMPDLEAFIVDATVELREVTVEELLDATFFTSGASGGTRWKSLAGAGVLLFDALDPKNAGAVLDSGICPNIMSAGLDPMDVDELFYLDDVVLQGRGGEFIWWDAGPVDITYEEADSTAVQTLLADSPDSLRRIYEKFIQEDGSLVVSDEYRTMLDVVSSKTRPVTSGDFTPVFMVGKATIVGYDMNTSPDVITSGFLYLRHAFRQYEEGILYTQSLIALQAATAAFSRAPEDGEWIAIRLFDAFPELDEFLAAIENWVRTLAEALQSMADAIVKYIEFVQAQIVELQQLIRRINALIQALLSFTITLPQFSGLMLLSEGTDGLMADLVAADNKPSDSPLSYGGGVALVIPFGPAFILDLIQVMAADGDSQDIDGTTGFGAAPPAIGIEAIEPELEVVTDEPDVL